MAAELVRIADATAGALEPYLAIRERDLVGRAGAFVAEGEVVVRVLAEQSRYRMRSLLLEERRVEAMRDVLDRAPDGTPAYVVPQKIMDAVVGFHIHRGVLAIGERGPALHPETLLREIAASAAPAIVVGLVGLTNHDNVGGIFRNAAAFGVRGVLLDDATCDPLYRKSIRVSVGAALVVPFARCESPDAMLDVVERASYDAVALTPRAETAIDALAPAARRVLLLGTEGEGLPDRALARARPVRIDMAPGLDSLNVAVAGGIALYEAFKTRRDDARR